MFDWKNSTDVEKVGYLGIKLQAARNNLHTLQTYYDGCQPPAFLSQDEQDELQNKIKNLGVNYCRLLTDTLVDKLTILGFRAPGADTNDPTLASAWTRNHMQQEADWLLRDVLALGRGYLSVWVDAVGHASITVESPFQVTSYHDPVTRECVGALKMWSNWNDVLAVQQSWAVLYLPDRIVAYAATSPNEPASIPAYGWTHQQTVPNPLGVVTVVEFLNRSNVLDLEGQSEYLPILGLQDALNKSLLDSMIASEHGSFLRRWIIGAEIHEDDDGNPVSPFSSDRKDVWQVEEDTAKIGQFEAASLQSFDTQANLLTRQIAAVTGLPEYMTGTGTTNPVSSDAMNVANLALNARAQSKIDSLSPAFRRAGALVLAIETGTPVLASTVSPIWAKLEVRTDAAATDSFVKLVQAGVPMDLAAEVELGWTPEQSARLRGVTPPKVMKGTNTND